jgi:hypothetical protein
MDSNNLVLILGTAVALAVILPLIIGSFTG